TCRSWATLLVEELHQFGDVDRLYGPSRGDRKPSPTTRIANLEMRTARRLHAGHTDLATRLLDVAHLPVRSRVGAHALDRLAHANPRCSKQSTPAPRWPHSRAVPGRSHAGRIRPP